MCRLNINRLHYAHSCYTFGLCDAKIVRPGPDRPGSLFVLDYTLLLTFTATWTSDVARIESLMDEIHGTRYCQ